MSVEMTTMEPETFAIHIKELCLEFGGSTTSWGRTVAHNHAVGGVEHSPHVAWVAADVVYDVIPPLGDMEAAAGKRNLKVIREYTQDTGHFTHDHFQPLDWNPAVHQS